MSSVKIGIFRDRDLSYIDKKQVVQFEIIASKINNPKKTIKTLIIQNNNLNQSISDLKPQYTIGNKLIYKYNSKASFNGGNEFLYFENKNIRGSDLNIRTFDLKDIYHNYLYPDTPRNSSTYSYNPDINGNFLVTAVDAQDVDIEADYVVVHFYLNIDKLDNNKSIYVSGNFNGYQLSDTNKMSYNSFKNSYEAKLKLKQGFYNYKYSVLDGENMLESGFISGNFDETENNYKVIVYYRDFGSRYDRVIGFNQVTRGIKIEVKQNFEGTFYKNHKIHFAFGYIVSIENRSKDTVQLNSRHWTILDSLNRDENIDGEGVIGKKPVLNPGETHVYNSGCLLLSPFGSMKGHYKMIDLATARKFNVTIPSFKLSAPFALN